MGSYLRTIALNYVHTVQLGPIAISEDRWVPTVKDNSSERYTVQLGPIAISEDRWVPTVKDNSSEVYTVGSYSYFRVGNGFLQLLCDWPAAGLLVWRVNPAGV